MKTSPRLQSGSFVVGGCRVGRRPLEGRALDRQEESQFWLDRTPGFTRCRRASYCPLIVLELV
eukprot:3652747-Pyramimonas_sp.AAC.1